MNINGVILVNKERNISSNSVVNKVKWLLKADKAGHYGTLDVLGEGLLPVALGKGTKLFDYFLNKDKVYKTIFKFGETTATLDLEGEITQKNDVVITRESIEKILPNFIGKMNQMPPQFSAKKINGKKAYQLAREGIEVDLKPKEIEIYSIKLLKEIDKNTFEFEIWCSSGTFIRSICRDLASKLNTYGVMLSIIRTRCGIFNLNDSFSINDIENGKFNIISLDSIFDYETFYFNEDITSKLLNGMTILFQSKNNEKIKCYGYDNSFLGIGNVENNKLKLELRLI